MEATGAVEFESPHPAAASPPALAHEAAVTEDGLTHRSSWEPSPPRASPVVLVGRATRVPQAAGTSAIQRTLTVTSRRPVGWAHAPDLGWGSGPKLHGMQAVTDWSLGNPNRH
jgi:hypothetical protein